MRRPRTSIALLAGALAACTTVQPQPTTPELRTGQSVEIGASAVARVGTPIFVQYSYLAGERAVTTAPYTRAVLAARISIPAGMPLSSATVDGKRAFCTNGPVYTAPGETRGVCMVDGDGDGRFERAYVVGTLSSMPLDVSVPYRTTEVSADPSGVKYELLYLGRDHDVIHATYREFRGDMDSPAYEEDLVYTLTPAAPTSVSFRNLRMEIFGADNDEIRYRVLRKFEG